MKMTSFTARVFCSLRGYSYAIKPGVPVEIRAEDVAEALALGITPVSMDELKAFEAKPVIEPVVIPTGTERETAILQTLQDIRQKNARMDFRASGFPRTDLVETKLGYEVTQEELETLWMRLTAKGRVAA